LEAEHIPFLLRIKLFLKRHLSVQAQKKIKGFIGSFAEVFSGGRRKVTLAVEPVAQASERLEAGDLVRIRSREEIAATLDHWRSLKGCGFLDEMAIYCGTTQRVLKRVERFMDERDYRFKKTSGVILLENVICSGTSGTGRCDRCCFFFWREEWLDKQT